MTTPQLIDGGKSPPCPHHPAVRSDTMTERRRCLAWVDQLIKDKEDILKRHGRNALTRDITEQCIEDLALLRSHIESGEQP